MYVQLFQNSPDGCHILRHPWRSHPSFPSDAWQAYGKALTVVRLQVARERPEMRGGVEGAGDEDHRGLFWLGDDEVR